jgi:hypothetical protein
MRFCENRQRIPTRPIRFLAVKAAIEETEVESNG